MKHVDINKYKVEPGQSVKLSQRDTRVEDGFVSREELRKAIDENGEELNELQQALMAEGIHGVVFALQALDAAGKDEAERYLFSRLSSQGLRTTSLSKPNDEELAHDYLWRLGPALPKRGEIGVLNRSHYEEVIGARINEAYKDEPLPVQAVSSDMWQKRFKHINNFEEYLFDNGFYMIKLYLHVSKEVQKDRLLERMEDPKLNWEFSFSDLEDRSKWNEQMEVFEDALEHTSTEKAPWFVIPADDGEYGRYLISKILLTILQEINPQRPELSKDTKEKLQREAEKLRNGKYD